MTTPKQVKQCDGCVHEPHVLGRCNQLRPDGLKCTCVLGPPPTYVDNLNLEYAIDRWHNRNMNGNA